MGTGTVRRSSTLTAPVSPDRLRPPAGALLYCHPERESGTGGTGRDVQAAGPGKHGAAQRGLT